MKNYSQITFEFQEPTEQDENAGVGVRIKSLKKTSRQANPEGNSNSETLPASQSLFGDSPGLGSEETGGEVEKHSSPVEESGTIPNSSQPIPDNQPIFEEDLSLTEEAASAGNEIIFDFTALPVTSSAVDHTEEIAGNDNSITPDGTNEKTADVKTPKSNRGRKSLKTIEEGAERINIPPDEELFKKQYYAIGEVAEMFQVNQSLLRFWETEFDIIQPRKNRKGDRHFRPIDIKNLLLIHDLLRRRKLTIEGAKDFLKKNKRSPERFAMIQSLQKIKGFLLEVRATL